MARVFTAAAAQPALELVLARCGASKKSSGRREQWGQISLDRKYHKSRGIARALAPSGTSGGGGTPTGTTSNDLAPKGHFRTADEFTYPTGMTLPNRIIGTHRQGTS
jgi:hypothetical protein